MTDNGANTCERCGGPGGCWRVSPSGGLVGWCDGCARAAARDARREAAEREADRVADGWRKGAGL